MSEAGVQEKGIGAGSSVKQPAADMSGMEG